MAIHLRVLCILLLATTFDGSLAQSRKELNEKEMSQGSFANVDPSKVIQLSWQPRVFLYRGFLSEEECDYLISQVHGRKSDDTMSNDGLFKAQMDHSLSLDSNNEIATRIEEKISAWTFLSKEYSEPLRTLHFGPEDPKNYYNYFDKKSTEQASKPLLATVILYLSNVSQGGQILFPKSDEKMWSDCKKSSKIIRPTRGNAIIFFSQHLNATPDSSSLHARCPVLDGEMWFATKFFYLKMIKIDKQVHQSNDADCTDEDDNCPRWAALGECQRNSVFMIGSPDYYGTCRKSCNVC